MSRPAGGHRAPRRRTRAAGLVGLGVLISAVGGLLFAPTYSTPPTAAQHPTRAAVRGDSALAPIRPANIGVRAERAQAAVAHAPPPIRLRIPSIGVDTSLQALGLQPDGTLQAPSQWQVAGWFRDGVRPGDPGPAVIAGHIDSVSGPAVFFRLAHVQAGDTALVTRADGSTLRFVIDDIARYRKDSFPDATVYGPQPLPVLRLITCTGEFDWNTHNYLDNLVVSAHLT